MSNVAVPSPAGATGSGSGDDERVLAEFSRRRAEAVDSPVAVSAIRVLTAVIERSHASTMRELLVRRLLSLRTAGASLEFPNAMPNGRASSSAASRC